MDSVVQPRHGGRAQTLLAAATKVCAELFVNDIHGELGVLLALAHQNRAKKKRGQGFGAGCLKGKLVHVGLFKGFY